MVEGETEEDLGINFREIARKIFSKYVIPKLMQIEHAYDVLASSGLDVTTQWETQAALRDWGFLVDDYSQRASDADGILAYHARLDAERDGLPFEIDGVVVKLDDLAAREELGRGVLGQEGLHPNPVIGLGKALGDQRRHQSLDLPLQVAEIAALEPGRLLIRNICMVFDQ